MLPIASTPLDEPRAAPAPEAPRHLLSSIRKLNALYDELNAIIAQARSVESAPRR
jgi:hypothetical protein